MSFILLLCTLPVLLSIFFYLTKNYNYWKIQNVPFAPKAIAGFGHILPLLTLQENLGSFINKLYQQMGKHSMYGCYLMQTPALVLRDPELIKCVLHKNFSSFRNNMLSVHEVMDPILSKNPFFANDEVWSTSRVQLVKGFTVKKMRYLFAYVVQVCDKFIDYIDRKIDQPSDSEIELENLSERVVGEVVANYVFGIEGQSFHDKSDQQSFFSVVKSIFDATTLNGIQNTITYFLPALAYRIGIRLVPKKTDEFLRSHLTTFINSVRENDEDKKDYTQFPIDEVDSDMMIALATSIFFDGFEPISVVLKFMLYRLAENTLIQNKARDEVTRVLEQHDNKLTYEAMKRMTYLDQIIEETLRMHPVFADMSRVCTEKITLQGYDGLTCRLKPGDVVLISLTSLHMDEDFWMDPLVFDPDRFNVTNKSARSKYTFLGFGEGKRICPGRRFGTMTVKIIVTVLLQRYEVEPSLRSKGPMKMSTNTLRSVVEGGLWVQLKRLNAEN